MNPADDMTVFIPRVPKVEPRPAPLLPRWVAQVALALVYAVLGAVAAGLVILIALVLLA